VSGDRSPSVDCELLLDRLTAVIEEESDALTRSGAFFGQFTQRKNQLLRDLLLARRMRDPPAATSAFAAKTRNLQRLLSHNQRLLKAHIDAVRDVAAIIVDSIRRAESDGTYSRRFRR
jgi:flagellar biosynthesis/type III secretory pathway chaperone